jgi:hypothetical protein
MTAYGPSRRSCLFAYGGFRSKQTRGLRAASVRSAPLYIPRCRITPRMSPRRQNLAGISDRSRVRLSGGSARLDTMFVASGAPKGRALVYRPVDDEPAFTVSTEEGSARAPVAQHREPAWRRRSHVPATPLHTMRLCHPCIRAFPEKIESGGIPLRSRIGFKNHTGEEASMGWGSRIRRICGHA